MAKFCAWCGKPVEDDDVFCAYCGKRADGSDMPQPAAQQPVRQPQWQAAPPQPPQGWTPAAPQQPQQLQWQPPQPPQAPPPKKSKTGLIIGIIAAVVVIAAVLIGGFVWPGFFKKGDDGGKTDIPRTEATEAPKATKAPDAPKATKAPKETEKPAETPEPTPEPTEPPYVNTFADVAQGDWFYDAVYWAGKNGVVSGTAFQPNDNATRGQALTFLWRAAGEPAPALKVSPYTDVKEGDWYYAPVLWGFENGLISTSSDGQFHADGTLTRAQAVTFLCRAQGGSPRSGERSYWDVTADDWYFDAVNWAVENGIVGRGDSYAFQPDQALTRAGLIQMLYRAYDPAAPRAATTPPNEKSFAALGIDADIDNFGPKSYATITKNEGDHVTFTAEVTDYRVFEEDDGFPKRDGYEYRVMNVHIFVKNDPSRARTYLVGLGDYDCNNIVLYQDSIRTDDNGVNTHTVICNGVPEECTIWNRNDYENRDGYMHVYYTWTASVPKGYDGLVVGFRNREITPYSDQYLDDYYTNTNDFALFRMK